MTTHALQALGFSHEEGTNTKIHGIRLTDYDALTDKCLIMLKV